MSVFKALLYSLGITFFINAIGVVIGLLILSAS